MVSVMIHLRGAEVIKGRIMIFLLALVRLQELFRGLGVIERQIVDNDC